MKHLKTLGLIAVAAAALAAFAGTASATITSPAGTKFGGEIVATSTNFGIGGFPVECGHSEIRGTSVNAAGENDPGSTTVKVDNLTFAECNREVAVTGKGHLKVDSNGEITWTGARITLQMMILGFPIHCIYETNVTRVGMLTESVAPARWHLYAAPIQVPTSAQCSDAAVWGGTYTFTNPSSAVVVD